MIAGQKISGGGIHKHPGEPSGGMTHAKVSSSIPTPSVPSGDGQTSGVQQHKSMPAGKKVETLTGFPKGK